MGGIRSAPTYLLPHPSGYIFRYAIPKDIRPIIGKSELRYSLQTGILNVAKVRARGMAVHAHGIIQSLRKGTTLELTEQQINEIIRDRLKRVLDDDEEIRLGQPRRSREDAEEASWIAQGIGIDAQIALAENDYSSCAHLVDALIDDAGIKLDKDSEDYRRFYREVLKSQVKLAEIVAGRESGDYTDAKEKADKLLPVESNPVPTDQQPAGPTVSEVFEKYKAENVSTGIWTEKTTGEIETSIQSFIDVMGDLHLDAITRKTVVDYKDTLLKLPANIKKDPRYRDKAIPEILGMDDVKPMAPQTINKQIGRVSALFNWASQNTYMPSNPAEGLKVKLGKRVEAREPFTNADLDRIFSSPEYLEDLHTNSYQFWLPVIGLFTGCRLNEICQLHLDDIRMECGVWILDITDEGGKGKRLKNASSRRLVPIHPFITEDLNFVGWTEKLRSQGKRRLFPELTEGRDGYGKNVSVWFNKRYRQKLGVDKPFHSFRHTFITHLKHKMVNPVMLQEVVGHTVDSMTFGTYGQGYPVDTVYKELILKIDYGVDLGHLKASSFVSR